MNKSEDEALLLAAKWPDRWGDSYHHAFASEVLSLRDQLASEKDKSAALKSRISEFDKSIMAESRDPNGTIWEVANQFLARAEAAEAALAKVREELDDIKSSYAETIKEACDPPAKDDRVHCSCVPALRLGVAALTEKLEAAKRLTAPHLQEYAMRLEEENAALTEKVAAIGKALGPHY